MGQLLNSLNKYLKQIFAFRLMNAVAAVATMLFLVAFVSQSAGATITYFDIGTLGGDTAQGNAINQNGDIAGRSDLSSALGGGYHAFIWTASNQTMRDLGTIGGANSTSEALGINDSDQVVGQTGIGVNQHAFRWESDTMTDLGLDGGTASKANAINNNGIVGGSITNLNGTHTASVWSATGDITLIQTSSGNCEVDAINNNDVAVGICGGVGFMWSASAGPTSLGSNLTPRDINDSGVITGDTTTSPGIFVYHTDTQTYEDLNNLAVTFSGGAHAYGINNFNGGQIVGYYYTGTIDPCGSNHAFIWDPTNGFEDIGTQGIASQALSINDSGGVSGSAQNNGCAVSPSITMAATSTTAPTKVAAKWTVKVTKPTIAIASAAVMEGNNTGVNHAIQFPVTLSRPAHTTVKVNYTISALGTGSGYATAGTDFVAGTGTVTFTPSSDHSVTPTVQMITAAIKQDTNVEPNELFKVTLSAPTGGYILQRGASAATGNIINDDGVTGVRVGIGNANVWKGDLAGGYGTKSTSDPLPHILCNSTNTIFCNQANIWITLSRPVTTTTTVVATIKGVGTATTSPAVAGTDFKAIGPLKITFAPGQYQYAIAVPIYAHKYTQVNKTIFVTLSSPCVVTSTSTCATGISLGRATGVISILGND